MWSLKQFMTMSPRMNSHKPENHYVFLRLILFLIAIRPVIDLHGKYEGSGINAGGMLGFFLVLLILLEFAKFATHLTYGFAFTVLACLSIFLVGCIQLLFVDEKHEVLLSVSRFLVGFTPVLLVPLILQQSPVMQRDIVSKFFKVLLAASAAPFVIAWLQFFGLYPFSYYDYIYGLPFGRPTGGYFQPNSLGRLMVFITILTYIVSYSNKIGNRMKLTIIATAFSTAYISTHRTSILILALVILLFELYNFLFPSKVLAFRKFYLFFLFLLLGYILATLISDRAQQLISPATTERLHYTTELISKSLDHITSYKITDEDYMRGRGLMWQMSLELMQKAPFSTKLTGFGYEPFEPHNDFLRIYVSHGMLGLLSHALVFFVLFVSAWRMVDKFGRTALSVLYLYLFLFSMPLQPTSYPFFMWLFFLCYSFILCQPWRQIVADNASD
jgi:O-antigen ligase